MRKLAQENKLLFGLGAAFVVVTAVFIAAAALTQSSAAGIEAEAANLQSNSLPSVTHLSAARTDTHHLRQSIEALMAAPPSARPEILANISQARDQLDSDIQAYRATPWYPSEKALNDDLLAPRLARLDVALDPKKLESHDADALAMAKRELDVVDDIVVDMLDLNDRQSYEATARIFETRRQSARLALYLESLCAVLSLGAAVLAIRASRRYARLLKRTADLQAERADELETFAQRVAHDLVTPMTAVTLNLGNLARKHPDAPTKALLDRVGRSLENMRRLIHGIFSFARAGARPTPGARSRLGASIRAAVEELIASDPSPPSVTIDSFEDCDVACDEAMLGIVLSNLLGNAAKYTKDAPERDIVIRPRVGPRRVRVEVEDTGPGFPPAVEHKLFEPYFRAPGVGQTGLGLGLATVKRIIESHGGAVGAARGARGALFWFELPRPDQELPIEHAATADETRAEDRTTH